MEEINLYDLLRFYAKKWLTIASFAIAGAIIGVIFTYYIQQPLYKSSATVLLVGTNRTSRIPQLVQASPCRSCGARQATGRVFHPVDVLRNLAEPVILDVDREFDFVVVCHRWCGGAGMRRAARRLECSGRPVCRGG